MEGSVGTAIRAASISRRNFWKNLDPNSVALVNRERTSVAGHKFGVVGSRRRRNQRVVGGTPGRAVVSQLETERLVRTRTQPQEW